MRIPSGPIALLATLAVATAAAAASAQAAPAPKRQAAKPAAKQAAKPKGPTVDPRSLVPGVGGLKPKLPTPTGPTLAPTGPAAVAGPLPGLPGTSGAGLRATATNPLICGVDAAWGLGGQQAGWDRQGQVWAKRLAQTLRASKATVLRIRIDWASIEKTRGVYDFADADRFVRFCSGLNVQLVATVGSAPSWAQDNSPEVLRLFKKKAMEQLLAARAPRPACLPDLGRFARACAIRYRERIRRWEFWPEPDSSGMPVVARDAAGRPSDVQFSGDPRTYADMLKVFSTNMRAGNPDALIAVGGLADGRPTVATRFLGSLYANGARPYFDAVAMHPYSPTRPLAVEWVDAVREVMVRSGDTARAIWVTEWGWPTGTGGISELQQARWVKEGLALLAARPYVALACYHALNDWRTAEGAAGIAMPYGLVAANLTPKPALAAFADVSAGQVPQSVETAGVELMAPMKGEDGAAAPERVTVKVDAAHPGNPLQPIWQGVSQAYELNGAQLMEGSAARLAELGVKLVRFDPFPDPGCVAALPDGATPGAFDPARIDWAYTDRMVAAIAKAGAKPVFCFATMPTALSSPQGNPRMPRDPSEWAAFVQAAVRRYGAERGGVAYWELGSRPDDGSLALPEYLRLYDVFARAVTAADAKALVGGPGVAGKSAEWVKALADHCSQADVPLAFVSWQSYGASPADLAARVREFRDTLSANGRLKSVELLISEWNLTDRLSDAHDGLSAATYVLSAAEQLASAGPVTACFRQVRDGSDIRRLGARFTGRWGLLANDGTPKAAYNAMKLLGRMGGARLKADTDDTAVRVLASREGKAVRALLWCAGGAAGADVPVQVQIKGLPWKDAARGTLWVLHERLGNALVAPGRAELRAAGGFQVNGPDADISLALPAGGAALVELEAASAPLRISASTQDYVVYSGSSVRVEATVRNAGSARATFTPKLSCTDRSLQVEGPAPRSTSLAAGDSVSLQYDVLIPPPHALDQETIELACGEARASLQVRIASPVSVTLDAARADVKRPGAPPDSLDGTATARLTLTNHSGARTSATLVCGKTQQTVTIGPKAKSAADVTLQPPSNQPGNYSVPVRVLIGDRPDFEMNVAVGVPVLCRYASTTPRINGDLAEWAEAFPTALDRGEMVREKTWGGLGDLSALVFTMWDERCLYVAASVNDDVDYQPYPLARMAQGDSLQIAIDALRDAAPDAAGYSESDHEFILGMVAGRPTACRLAGPKTKSLGPMPGVQVAVRRVGSRTIYEAAIPWAELGPAKPKDGAAIGFSVLLNDNDGKGRGTMELTPGMAAEKAPGRFLALRLAKP